MDQGSTRLPLLRRIVPRRIKLAARQARSKTALRRAVRQIASLPVGHAPNHEMLEELISAWGNEGFAARNAYLEQVAKSALTTSGPIVECGTGLTTLLLGLIAGRCGIETWSLEHNPEWHAYVTGVLRRFGIAKVHVHLAPLRDYGEFTWYDPPLAEMPKSFRLVICDGPPGTTPGGRYGLLPVLGGHLTRESVILLDDATRPGEMEVLRRWTTKEKLKVSLHNVSSDAFAIVTSHTVPGRRADLPA